MTEKNTLGITENTTSCNTIETTVNSRKPTLMDQNHKKESRLCSSICGHHQKRGTTRRSIHPQNWKDSNKNSNERIKEKTWDGWYIQIEFNSCHREQQRKPSNIKSDIWWDNRKKYNIQGDIRTLLEKDCEVVKMMRFLSKIGIFEEIQRWQEANEISKLLVASYSHW